MWRRKKSLALETFLRILYAWRGVGKLDRQECLRLHQDFTPWLDLGGLLSLFSFGCGLSSVGFLLPLFSETILQVPPRLTLQFRHTPIPALTH
jgi:hypothetical protein